MKFTTERNGRVFSRLQRCSPEDIKRWCVEPKTDNKHQNKSHLKWNIKQRRRRYEMHYPFFYPSRKSGVGINNFLT